MPSFKKDSFCIPISEISWPCKWNNFHRNNFTTAKRPQLHRVIEVIQHSQRIENIGYKIKNLETGEVLSTIHGESSIVKFKPVYKAWLKFKNA